jgi:ApbE superfamily uncharacterized protein (UPF0280 family)
MDPPDAERVFAGPLHRARRRVEEADLLILSDLPAGIDVAVQSVTENMAELKKFIALNPSFRMALLPLDVEGSAPRAASMAASATSLAGVGPMAAIPGALADLAVERMQGIGCAVSLVEDGGEISAMSDRPILVAVYAGRSPVSGRFGFFLEKGDFPIGIATSSATVSQALNFGEADAAVVVATSATMADAAAKRVCNAVQGNDVRSSVEEGLRTAEEIPNVRGAIVVRSSHVGVVGALPRIVPLRGSLKEIFERALLDPDLRI